MKLKIRFTSIVLIIVLIIGALSMKSGHRMNYITYRDSLDETVVTVDGEKITLRDAAFYIVYEENLVEEQAFLYDPRNTGRYWSVHTNGKYIRTEAKQAVMDRLIHDEIFYRLGLKEGMELTEKERRYLENEQKDFWDDYGEQNCDVLGVTREVFDDSMYKIALAEKYQVQLAALYGKEKEAYDVSGEAYQEILGEHSYTINDDLWERVHFGSITVPH